MPRLIHDNRTFKAPVSMEVTASDPPPQNYTVNFVNNSGNSGTAYLFQTDPGLIVPAPASLAWFCYGSNPGVVNTFLWSSQYGMFWSTSATSVTPGLIVIASQNLPCGLTTNNEVTFSKNNFGYLFENQATGSPSGSIIIMQDNTIPFNNAVIGIGMSGAGAFAIPAQPNITAIFTPTPAYWIGFSLQLIQQGTVLDTQATYSAQIIFPFNMYTCTATLNRNNQWSLKYSL